MWHIDGKTGMYPEVREKVQQCQPCHHSHGANTLVNISIDAKVYENIIRSQILPNIVKMMCPPEVQNNTIHIQQDNA
jgi:hypothetical protein